MSRCFLIPGRYVIALALFVGCAFSWIFWSKIIWAQGAVLDVLVGAESVECIDAPDTYRWRPRDWQLISERILVFRKGRGDSSTYFLNLLQDVCDSPEFAWADAEAYDFEMHFANSFGSKLRTGMEVCANDWIVSRPANTTGRILPTDDCQLGAFHPIDAALGEQLLRADSIAQEIVQRLVEN